MFHLNEMQSTSIRDFLNVEQKKIISVLQPLWLQTRGKRMLSSDIEIDYFNLIFWNLFCAIAPCVSFFCRPLVHSKTKTLSIRLLKFLSWIHIIGYTAFTISMDVYGFCSIKHLGTSVKVSKKMAFQHKQKY